MSSQSRGMVRSSSRSGWALLIGCFTTFVLPALIPLLGILIVIWKDTTFNVVTGEVVALYALNSGAVDVTVRDDVNGELRLYEVNDSWLFLHLNSPEVYRQLQVGGRYEFTIQRWYVPTLLHWLENVYAVKKLATTQYAPQGAQ